VRVQRLRVLLAVLAAALVSTAAASAELVTREDDAGRTITFDVLAPDVDVEWYATLLRSAAHGDEISRVTIRIVAPGEIRGHCGPGASACYSRRGSGGTIVVPAGSSDRLASTVLHEYGHHLDAAWAVAGVQELNGTPTWWAARGLAALLAEGSVSFDYSISWDRSVGEIFAEDYAYLHLGGDYGIPWLDPPDDSLRTALLAELAAGPTTPVPPPAQPARTKPLTIVERGSLRARGVRTIPFGLLGPGRRVTVRAKILAPRRGPTAARVEVRCGGRLVKSLKLVGARAATIDRRNLGPARCEARLVSTGKAAQRFELRLRLAVERELSP
jgi:hypothetical protein